MPSAVDPEQPPASVIFGLAGETLTPAEQDFFKSANPLGFILFGRNCREPQQIIDLVSSLKECVGRDAPILIDQEGGRVRRLKPPHWTDIPAAKSFGDAFQTDFQKGRDQLTAAMGTMAQELFALGIQVNCAPVLDVLYPETHDAIGERAYSSQPQMVGALGRIVCETFLANKVIPVLKHLPGQGRAASDSHHALPVVDAAPEDMEDSDFLPFREILSKAFEGALWGMVAHVIYDKIDKNLPASCSRKVVYDIIRKKIGFQGLLLSDDIDMGALSIIGDAGKRAEQVLRAGCDIVLQCNGVMDDMEKTLRRAQMMTDQAVTRYNRSVSWLEPVS